MKNLYCAQCGKELLYIRKASKPQQKIYDMVEPHECSEDSLTFDEVRKVIKKEEKSQAEVNILFNSFRSVQKLNNLEKGYEVESENEKDKNLEGQPKTSTAPETLLKVTKE